MADLSVKHKIMKFLYGLGLKNFGEELLAELLKGSPEWFEIAESIMETNDLESRAEIIRQITAKGYMDRAPQKPRLVELALGFLRKGSNEERRDIVKFVQGHLHLFPKEDDAFQGLIIGLSRDKDVKLNQAASTLMMKLGIDMNDADIYRR